MSNDWKRREAQRQEKVKKERVKLLRDLSACADKTMALSDALRKSDKVFSGHTKTKMLGLLEMAVFSLRRARIS